MKSIANANLPLINGDALKDILTQPEDGFAPAMKKYVDAYKNAVK